MTRHVDAKPAVTITPMPAPARLAAALPDAVTAGFFLIVWLAPMALGESAVRNALLIMLVEFLVIHASGFLGSFVLSDQAPRSKRLLGLLGFSLFYLLFVTIFAWSFGEWWPFLAFGWLLLGKFAGVLSHRVVNAEQKQRMMNGWGLSVLLYIAGAFATVFVPVPRLGMGIELQSAFGLVGSGLWVEQPQRVVAFGFLYFAFTAWSKWRDWAAYGAGSRQPSKT